MSICQWISKLCQESYAGRPSWEVSFLRCTCEDMRTHSLSFSAAFLAFRDHEIFGSARFASRILSLSRRAPTNQRIIPQNRPFLRMSSGRLACLTTERCFSMLAPGVGASLHRCICPLCHRVHQLETLRQSTQSRLQDALPRSYSADKIGSPRRIWASDAHSFYSLAPHPPRGLRGAPESLLKKASRTLRVSRRTRNWARSPS